MLQFPDPLQVRWWDITVGKQDFRLDGHCDYVRSAAVSSSSPDTWATAGYDHICKLWDVRSQECIMNLDHGTPIEDVKFFPSGDGQGLVTIVSVGFDVSNTGLAFITCRCKQAVHLCDLPCCNTATSTIQAAHCAWRQAE